MIVGSVCLAAFAALAAYLETHPEMFRIKDE
jgi:hypothetical protein